MFFINAPVNGLLCFVAAASVLLSLPQNLDLPQLSQRKTTAANDCVAGIRYTVGQSHSVDRQVINYGFNFHFYIHSILYFACRFLAGRARVGW